VGPVEDARSGKGMDGRYPPKGSSWARRGEGEPVDRLPGQAMDSFPNVAKSTWKNVQKTSGAKNNMLRASERDRMNQVRGSIPMERSSGLKLRHLVCAWRGKSQKKGRVRDAAIKSREETPKEGCSIAAAKSLYGFF